MKVRFTLLAAVGALALAPAAHAVPSNPGNACAALGASPGTAVAFAGAGDGRANNAAETRVEALATEACS